MRLYRFDHENDLSHLRKKLPPFSPDEIDDTLVDLTREMIRVMKESNGVGLAANQVGLGKRVIILGTEEEPLVLINPEIVETSLKKSINEEGCLSIPNVRGRVSRAEKVIVQALNLNGKPFRIEAEGLSAVCLQHEIDHLDGILFIDRLIPADLKKLPRNIQKIRQ